MHIMLTFLLVNDTRLNCTNEDVVEAGLGVASGAMDYEKLLQWIRSHITLTENGLFLTIINMEVYNVSWR